MSQRILVWDVPTRVFHWLLVASFVGTFITAETERYRDIHVALGYVLFGLLGFRLVWGFCGTRYARFSSFIFKPREVFTYLVSIFERKPTHYVGHNPAGSVAIWLLLILGIVSNMSGVMIFEDFWNSDFMEELHEISSYAMLGIVLLHISGVMMSSMMHRENLAKSMLTGYKRGEFGQGIRYVHTWLGVIMIVVVVMFTYDYLTGGAVNMEDDMYQSEQYDDD